MIKLQITLTETRQFTTEVHMEDDVTSSEIHRWIKQNHPGTGMWDEEEYIDTKIKKIDDRGNYVDITDDELDGKDNAVCENCGKSCEYDSEMCLFPKCNPESKLTKFRIRNCL